MKFIISMKHDTVRTLKNMCIWFWYIYLYFCTDRFTSAKWPGHKRYSKKKYILLAQWGFEREKIRNGVRLFNHSVGSYLASSSKLNLESVCKII